MKTSARTTLVLQIIFVVILLGIIGFLYYEDFSLRKERMLLQAELVQTNTRLVETKAELVTTKEEYASTSAFLLSNIDVLNTLLSTTTNERDGLREALRAEQEVVDLIYNQVASVSTTVGTLQKLSETDKELLKKYSRVYFLNENFIPKALVTISASSTYDPSKEQLIMEEVSPFLEGMLAAAVADGVDLRVISAYRSFGTQSTLKSTYKMTYGAGTANKFSADQGYSEHQLGTTVDFTTKKLGVNFSTFEKEKAYTWLTQNAYKYGFALSYPKNNTYYIFEPWHWRFVGKSLAGVLHDNHKYFYDLPQRDIDQFLISLFDE